MFSEVDEVAAWLGKFLHLLKITVILIFHFFGPMRLPLQSGTINIIQGKFLI